MLISIIIPVYNAMEYLEKCVKSIEHQEMDDYELILVNDGSTDCTEQICRKLQNENPRIIVINKVNEGPSIARKVGLDIANGQYVSFVDADDFIDIAMYACLHELISSNDIDIVKFGYHVVSEDGIIIETKAAKSSYLIDGMHLCSNWNAFNKDETCYIWDKIFRKSLLNDIEFYSLFYSEDMIFLAQAFFKANRVYVYNRALYFHTMSANGLCRQTYSEKQFDQITAGKYLYGFYMERLPELIRHAQEYICTYAAKNYCKARLSNYDNLLDDIKNSFLSYYNGRLFFKMIWRKEITFRRYVFILLFRQSPDLCSFLFPEGK